MRCMKPFAVAIQKAKQTCKYGQGETTILEHHDPLPFSDGSLDDSLATSNDHVGDNIIKELPQESAILLQLQELGNLTNYTVPTNTN
mmetsp:Transcript_20574/g.38518  ORF Transcript_20574/g.38518 Transcript_20574/m.38518 type:complete len:87 (-) Transcript_20574:1144-1404(-)